MNRTIGTVAVIVFAVAALLRAFRKDDAGCLVAVGLAALTLAFLVTP